MKLDLNLETSLLIFFLFLVALPTEINFSLFSISPSSNNTNFCPSNDDRNPRVPCRTQILPSIDLSKWAEFPTATGHAAQYVSNLAGQYRQFGK